MEEKTKSIQTEYRNINDSMAEIHISRDSKPDDEGNAVGCLDSHSVLENPSTSTNQQTNQDGEGNAVGSLDLGSVSNPSTSIHQQTNPDSEGNAVGCLDSGSISSPSTSTHQQTNPGGKGDAVACLDSGSVSESSATPTLQDTNPVSPSRSETPHAVYSRRINVWTAPKDRGSISKDDLELVLRRFGKVETYELHNFWVAIFATSSAVEELLSNCESNNDVAYYFYRDWLYIFPWKLCDISFMKQPTQDVDVKLSVSVTRIPFQVTAKHLFDIMNNYFSDVIKADISQDVLLFPTGTAIVYFSSQKSFIDAITAGSIPVITDNFSRKLSTYKIVFRPNYTSNCCEKCAVQHGPLFCYHSTCCVYYCKRCWNRYHAFGSNRNHTYYDCDNPRN